MSRPRKTDPTYRFHRQTGRACVSVYKADGERTEVILPGEYDSPESKEEYDRLVALIKTNRGRLPEPPGNGQSPADLTIAELVEQYLREHVEQHYRRPDGTATSERGLYIASIRPLVRLFGPKLAREFTALDLRQYREALIHGSWLSAEEREQLARKGRDGKHCRRVVNQEVGRIRRLFRWAVSYCLFPGAAAVVQALACVPGLQPGRSEAKDHPEVEAVSLEHIEKTLPHLPEHFQDIVRLQLYSAARAGELLSARTCDIDQEGPQGIWVLRPMQHKNRWRGHRRQLVFGPKCQLILKKYLRPDEPERVLFQPLDTQWCRDRAHLLKFKSYFTVAVYDSALARACERAKVPCWSSHQLRHLAARIAEQELSLEKARSYLGHKGASLTAMYAGLDLEAAAEVGRLIG